MNNAKEDTNSKTVFELNNDAVMLLQRHQHDQAITKLLHILHRLDAAIQDPEFQGFSLKSGNLYGSQNGRDLVRDVGIMAIPANDRPNHPVPPPCDYQGPGGDPLPEEDSFVFHFFDQAFVTHFIDYQGKRGVDLVRAFVLYNLGLCFHSQGVGKP